MFFFFKQKTAYEMRISDWSSDVCSSDLGAQGGNSAAQVQGVPTSGWRQPLPAHSTQRLQALVVSLPTGRRRAGVLHRGVPKSHAGGGPCRTRSGDRKSVVEGKRVSVRVDLGGRRIIKKKKRQNK